MNLYKQVYQEVKTIMKERILAVILAVMMIFAIVPLGAMAKTEEGTKDLTAGSTLYFSPYGQWTEGSERYAAFFFTSGSSSSDAAWVNMEAVPGTTGFYSVQVPSTGSYPNVLFCRFNSAYDPTAPGADPWNDKDSTDTKYLWNQTVDLTVPSGCDCFMNSNRQDTDRKYIDGVWSVFSERKTIYAVNNDNWAAVNIHYWNDEGFSTTWPGVTMTRCGAGSNYYMAVIPSTVAKVKFSNNGANETGNITSGVVDGASFDLGNNGAVGAHIHQDANGSVIAFNAWNSLTELPPSSGSYYLENDVILSGKWTVPEGTTNLCLHGHSIRLDVDGFVISFNYFNTVLNLFDDAGSSAVITHTSGRKGGGIDVVRSTLNMYGGKISGNTADANTCSVNVQGGVFNMYDGTISGNSAYYGVFLWSYTNSSGTTAAEFNMYGGTISGNTATEKGGGVYVSEGSTFTMNGGTISNNTVSNTYSGSGVCVEGSTFVMNGGLITNHTGRNVVYVESGTFTMNDGSISDNSPSSSYSVVRLTGTSGSRSTFNMDGGSISDNSPNYCCVYEDNENCDFYMSDGSISNNLNALAAVCVRGNFFMSGGSITYNDRVSENNFGYVVYLSNSKQHFEMTGGSITDNVSEWGGVYFYRSGAFIISGSPVISGNKNHAGDPCNVYSDDKTITVNGSLTAAASVGVTWKDLSPETVFTSGLPGNGVIGNFTSDNPNYDVILSTSNSNEAMLIPAPRASFKAVQIRPRAAADGKKDLRFVFDLTLDYAKIEINGAYYGCRFAKFEIYGLQASVGRGKPSGTWLNLNTIFSVADSNSSNYNHPNCHPFCTFTVVVTNINENTESSVEFAVQIRYSYRLIGSTDIPEYRTIDAVKSSITGVQNGGDPPALPTNPLS